MIHSTGISATWSSSRFRATKHDAPMTRRSRLGFPAAIFALVSLATPSVAHATENQEVPPCSVFDLFCSTGTSQCATCKKSCQDKYDADKKECNKIEVASARVDCMNVAKGVQDSCIIKCTIDDKCQDSGT